MFKEEKWKIKTINKIKGEALRVLDRIKDFELDENKNKYPNHKISAIKRATLDFNREAVKLRKGYYRKN